jgi:very-short-patch-repair endonuclease
VGRSFDKRIGTHELVSTDWTSMDERLRDYVFQCVCDYAVDLIIQGDAELCESPIETLMSLALAHKAPVYLDFDIRRQETIETPDGKFRVDFLIALLDAPNKDVVDLVVECDGHDFHERTKEQAARDKARDRSLKRAGHDVIRFTGSEIWRDPDKCATEAWDTVRALRDRRR